MMDEEATKRYCRDSEDAERQRQAEVQLFISLLMSHWTVTNCDPGVKHSAATPTT